MENRPHNHKQAQGALDYVFEKKNEMLLLLPTWLSTTMSLKIAESDDNSWYLEPYHDWNPKADLFGRVKFNRTEPRNLTNVIDHLEL